jgi:hypothetical protein
VTWRWKQKNGRLVSRRGVGGGRTREAKWVLEREKWMLCYSQGYEYIFIGKRLGLPHIAPNLPNTRITNDSNTTLYSIKALATTDVETRLKLREHRGGQPLGEDVCELGSRWDVEDTNVPDDNVLVDEVEINLNMLGALVLDGVGFVES